MYNTGQFKKGHISWNKKDIKIYCKYCDKEIYPRRHLKVKYCSNECKYADFKGKTFKGSEKGQFKKGMKPWNKNLSPEKSPTWMGGKTFEPYSINFTKKIKEKIKERHGYRYHFCRKKESKLKKEGLKNRGLAVHHIDYDKKNCNPDNLITLCRSCHSKTNVNRKYWTKFWGNEVDSDIDLNNN